MFLSVKERQVFTYVDNDDFLHEKILNFVYVQIRFPAFDCDFFLVSLHFLC